MKGFFEMLRKINAETDDIERMHLEFELHDICHQYAEQRNETGYKMGLAHAKGLTLSKVKDMIAVDAAVEANK